MRSFALILAALAAATLDWSGPARSASPAPAAAPDQRLPHVSIRTLGKGDPTMLIPGLGTPREVWDGLVPELARHHKVILVQVNGFGGDDPAANLQPGVLDGIAADLHAYIARERLGPVRLIGHSMGALVGLKLTLAHPEQVERLMIVDALPFFGVLVDKDATVDALRPMAEMMRSKVAATYGKPVDPAAAEANIRGLALKPASLERMKAWSMTADPRVTSEALFEDLTTDLRPELARIKVPLTLLYPYGGAGFSEAKTLDFYKRQYSATPQVQFIGIADSGHFVMLDQPERFAAEVRKFVQ
jgi:pimeloyl-ACP methyl ester carboxylesterase